MDSFPLYYVDGSHMMSTTLVYMYIDVTMVKHQVVLCAESYAGRNYGNRNVNKLTCRPKSAPLKNSTARSVVIIHKITIRIKSGEQGFPGFSVLGRLGGVIYKPEGAP